MPWVVRVVELTSPSEKIYGPFEHAKAATDFVYECHRTGRSGREQWQSSQASWLFPPDAEGPYDTEAD